MKSLKPLVHRDVAVLKNCPDLHREGLITVIALLYADASALAFQRLDAVRCAAMRADGTAGPQLGLDPRIGHRFVVEPWLAKDGHGNLHAL